jgi:hypothetical protein
MSAETKDPALPADQDWRVVPLGDGYEVVETQRGTPTGHKVARITRGWMSREESSRNARLVAVSPDMLALLREVAKGRGGVPGVLIRRLLGLGPLPPRVRALLKAIGEE